jgi:hypothetical protein
VECLQKLLPSQLGKFAIIVEEEVGIFRCACIVFYSVDHQL